MLVRSHNHSGWGSEHKILQLTPTFDNILCTTRSTIVLCAAYAYGLLILILFYSLFQAPGMKYRPGYNTDMGDSGLLTKTKIGINEST